MSSRERNLLLILVVAFLTAFLQISSLNNQTTPPLQTAAVGDVSTDTDSDGMDDSWENTNFGNLDAKPGDDADSDLLTNLEEFKNDNNPKEKSNLALGKSYTWSVTPDNQYVTDSADVTQLTDGAIMDPRYSALWRDETPVGWSDRKHDIITITVDLGLNQPINAVKFFAGWGRSYYPMSKALVEFSEDGENYYSMGDLRANNSNVKPVPATTIDMARYDFLLSNLNSHGRYVKITILPVAGTLLVEEISVYGGGSNNPYPSTEIPIGDNAPETALFREKLTKMASKVESQASSAGISVSSEINAIKNRIKSLILTPTEMTSFRSIFPQSKDATSPGIQALGSLQRDILTQNARVLTKQGYSNLTLWLPTIKWKAVDVFDSPSTGNTSGTISLKLMNGEVGSYPVFISNGSNTEKTVSLSFEGLPGGSQTTIKYVLPLDMQAYDNMFVDPLINLDSGSTITIPSGMTAQVWLNITPSSVSPGHHTGKFIATEGSTKVGEIPISMDVSNFNFPSHFSLGWSGWDNMVDIAIHPARTDPTRRVVQENFDKVVNLIKEYQYDVPLVGARNTQSIFNSVDMVSGINASHFDSSNKFIPPAGYFSHFDTWVRRFPDAKNYIIYFGLIAHEDTISATWHKTFAGANYETDNALFRARIRGWAEALEEHIVSLGLRPDRFSIFLIDEMYTIHDTIFVNWAKAFVERPVLFGSRLQMFIDPTRNNPADSPVFDGKTAYDYMDFVCPNFPVTLTYQKTNKNFDFLKSLGDKGKKTCLYTGSTLSQPPYVPIVHAWLAYKYGLSVLHYQSVMEVANKRNLNFYNVLSPHSSFFYFDNFEFYPSRRLEGWREGREHYEYLTILKSFKRYIETNQPSRGDLISEIDNQINSSVNAVTSEALAKGSVSGLSDHTLAGREKDTLWTLIDRLSRELGIQNNSFFPTPVNASCGFTNNSCNSGTLSDTDDTDTNYLWSCNGSNGGTNASCTLSKTASTPTPTPNPDGTTPAPPTPTPTPNPDGTTPAPTPTPDNTYTTPAPRTNNNTNTNTNTSTYRPSNTTNTTGTTKLVPKPTINLSRGSTGPDVTLFQQAMVEENLLTQEQVTGIYDLPTENAVKAFQSKYDIVPPNDPSYGKVDARTVVVYLMLSVWHLVR